MALVVIGQCGVFGHRVPTHQEMTERVPDPDLQEAAEWLETLDEVLGQVKDRPDR